MFLFHCHSCLSAIEFSQGWVITQPVDAEADVTVQKASVKPGTDEICRYVQHCHSAQENFFVLENRVTSHLKKICITLTVGILSFFSEVLIFFSVLISNTINIKDIIHINKSSVESSVTFQRAERS